MGFEIKKLFSAGKVTFALGVILLVHGLATNRGTRMTLTSDDRPMFEFLAGFVLSLVGGMMVKQEGKVSNSRKDDGDNL